MVSKLNFLEKIKTLLFEEHIDLDNNKHICFKYTHKKIHLSLFIIQVILGLCLNF